jgi:hypothetical protein
MVSGVYLPLVTRPGAGLRMSDGVPQGLITATPELHEAAGAPPAWKHRSMGTIGDRALFVGANCPIVRIQYNNPYPFRFSDGT